MTATSASTASDSFAAAYRYDRFTFKLLTDDLRFHRGTLAPGAALSVSEAEGADGSTVRLRGTGRPLLLVTGSMSCPMTASSMPSVVDLHADFAEQVDFVLLSAREAHPGEFLAQPASAAEARDQARRLQEFYGVPFPVVVDDADGTLHRVLDSKPNAAFLFDGDGILAFRSLWASDHNGLRSALAAVARGRSPRASESRAMVAPMARALGFIDEVIDRAGPSARRDLWRSVFPMAIAAWMTKGVAFVHPARRGAAAGAVALCGLAVTVLAVLAA